MTKKLEKLLRFGFPTAELCVGGDESAQCPRWLAARQQSVLLQHLREFNEGVEKVGKDPNLTGMGKDARRRELAMGVLAKLKSEDGHRLLDLIQKKANVAKNRLAAAERPTGESDIDRLAHLMRVQGVQAFLKDMNGQTLLAELNRAVTNRDSTMFSAIMEIPSFILREKGLTGETIVAASKAWREATSPALAKEVEIGEQMAQLAEQNLSEVVAAVEEAGGIESRQVTVTK
ncbi:MAG TPA: hypothetical protein VLM89_12660 [Phycisphaerae bacterium]|nr:hypothetical protein [Phycisphaerae bacterium]